MTNFIDYIHGKVDNYRSNGSEIEYRIGGQTFSHGPDIQLFKINILIVHGQGYYSSGCNVLEVGMVNDSITISHVATFSNPTVALDLVLALIGPRTVGP